MKNALRYQDSSDDEMPGLQEEDLPSDADAGDDLPDLPDDLSLLSDGERELIDEALEQLKAEEAFSSDGERGEFPKCPSGLFNGYQMVPTAPPKF